MRNGATFVEDESLQSPLHASCQIGHLNLTKRIVEMKYNDINIISKLFTTPFHLACFNGHLSIVKYLIAANANTEAVNNFGETPLFSANEGEQLKLIKFLIEEAKVNAEARDNSGTNILSFACHRYLPIKIVKYFISKGMLEKCINDYGEEFEKAFTKYKEFVHWS